MTKSPNSGVCRFPQLQNLNSEGYASIPPSDTEHEYKNMFFILKVKVLEFMGSFEILNGIILYILKDPFDDVGIVGV